MTLIDEPKVTYTHLFLYTSFLNGAPADAVQRTTFELHTAERARDFTKLCRLTIRAAFGSRHSNGE